MQLRESARGHPGPPRYLVTVDLEGIDQTVACHDWNQNFPPPALTQPPHGTERAPASSVSLPTAKDAHGAHPHQDYRLSQIMVVSVGAKGNNEKPLAEPLKAQYMGYGVVRLYREYAAGENEIEVESDDTTVAIVAVPNYFSPTDVLGFIGENVIRQVSHFRMVKSDNPNRFMVLMKFRSNESARAFQDLYNGRPFSAMELESCRTIFVKSVLFKPLNAPTIAGIPYLLEDPFTLQVKKSTMERAGETLEQGSIVKELPTCPVCLERMDSDLTGLVTISCQHTFHCNCLSKWRDDTCPVCRYSNLSLDPLRRNASEESIQHCSSCGGSKNLWICLICGNIGCGRYDSKHAIQHYESTSHCFSMDINTQRVWDYAGDNYVHRLLQNETDGKLVELPASGSCSSSEYSNDKRSFESLKDKNRDYSIEYSDVLLSQLESQREYYESRLAEAAAISTEVGVQKQQLEERVWKVEKQLKAISQPSGVLMDNAKEMKVAKDLARMFEKKWKDEQAITERLSTNLGELKDENKKLAEQNKNLQEDLSDLMKHLEMQQRLQDAPEELRSGQIVIQPPPQIPTAKSKKKRK